MTFFSGNFNESQQGTSLPNESGADGANRLQCCAQEE
jgi:hypothetical protein